MHFTFSRPLRPFFVAVCAVAAMSLAGIAQIVTNPEQAPAPKKPGTVRIGILMPRNTIGAPGDLSAGEPIRNTARQLLTAPKIEAVKINSLLPAQALAEAAALDCDYVLSSSLSQKAKSGGFGGLRALSSFAPMASMVPRAGIAAMNAAATAERAFSVATSASAVKAKAEVTFEYSLTAVSGAKVVSDSETAKAKTDGEDVITPLIEQAATRIVAAVSK